MTRSVPGSPALAWAAAIAFAACGPPDGVDETGVRDTASGKEASMAFDLTSPAFDPGGAIPDRYSCDGEDVSPPLAWADPPEGTVELALIVDDPDAPGGTFTHWVLYGLPGHFSELPEDVGPAQRLENLGEARQGENDFGRVGWGGPCPPRGPEHHYVFRLHALDARLGLDPGVAREELERLMEGHALGTAELAGTYARR